MPKATCTLKGQFTPLILLELYMFNQKEVILLYFLMSKLIGFYLICIFYFYKNWLISGKLIIGS